MAKRAMTVFLIVLMAFGLAGAFWLVVMNRASPAVVNAAVPVAFGAISAIGLVFAFTRPEPITRAFPVLFVVERASLLPIVLSDRTFPFQSLALADRLRQIDPRVFEPSKDQQSFDYAVPLYHEYLQKVIVDNIAMRHIGTWRVQVERFNWSEQFGPMPDASAHASTVLNAGELEKAFGNNRFARVPSMMGTLALPPKTRLEIDPPHTDRRLGEVGTIRLKNRFCEVTIQTVQSVTMVGLGAYTMFSEIPQDKAQEQYWSFQYVTRINATFPWYLIGHPEMAAHRDWAAEIIENLAHAFDEDALWRKTTENYMLRRHLPPAVQAQALPMGPIRSTPAPKPAASSAPQANPPVK